MCIYIDLKILVGNAYVLGKNYIQERVIMCNINEILEGYLMVAWVN